MAASHSTFHLCTGAQTALKTHRQQKLTLYRAAPLYR